MQIRVSLFSEEPTDLRDSSYICTVYVSYVILQSTECDYDAKDIIPVTYEIHETTASSLKNEL